MVKITVNDLARQGRKSAKALALAGTGKKNLALRQMAIALDKGSKDILAANAQDLLELRERGDYSSAFHDRLKLTEDRIAEMAAGLESIAALPDPVGEVVEMKTLANGLQVGKIRVPLGLVGIIYEARPNVTVDAAGLAIKSGNAVLLRGGSEAINSNKALVKLLQQGLAAADLPREAVSLVEDTSRAAAEEMMKLRGLLDVLIPRGGASLINTVVEKASVPVIETGVGNCHTYVDQGADLKMAVEIVVNAKTHRPGVCNAMETLLVHREAAPDFLPAAVHALQERDVEIRGCPQTCKLVPGITPARELDWETEYLDLILAVKVVSSLEEALEHISRYGTGHSEAIITRDYYRARRFQTEVDAAAVYVNASTRFTDGYQFGLGGEMGISTQKLHARGPMGLKELTSTKYIVYGDGQIRN